MESILFFFSVGSCLIGEELSFQWWGVEGDLDSLRLPGLLTKVTGFILKNIEHVSLALVIANGVSTGEEETPMCPQTKAAFGFPAAFAARERYP